MLNSFRWYRRLRKGNWKYVVCKYPAPICSCWIRSGEKFWFEFIEREENY